MKRYIAIVALSAVVAHAGCKPAHPSKIVADPSFEPNRISAILIAPFVSSVPRGEDPDRQSERIMNRTLAGLLAERSDYRFLSQDQFQAAVARAGLGDHWASFSQDWMSRRTVDKEFLAQLKVALNVDVLMLPHVFLWNKDEADYRESAASSATQVGATLALFETTTGTILWEASDQNYRESVRSESRGVISGGGIDRRVAGVSGTGRDAYAAPPYEEVAQIVLEALVGALPPRSGSAR
jgi:hypothetical protein